MAFAKYLYSLQEKQHGLKSGSDLDLHHGFISSSVCCFFLDFCASFLITAEVGFCCVSDWLPFGSGSLFSAGNIISDMAVYCCWTVYHPSIPSHPHDIFLRIISESYDTYPISSHTILDPMATPSMVLPPVNGPWRLQIHEAKYFPPVEVAFDVEMF